LANLEENSYSEDEGIDGKIILKIVSINRSGVTKLFQIQVDRERERERELGLGYRGWFND
jgi:hypothetical protein